MSDVPQPPSTAPTAQLPQQYVTPPAAEAGELRWIRRMDWEAIRRAVRRCKPGDSFNASWASFLAGVGASAVIALISVRLTVATDTKPYSTVQVLFALIAGFSVVCGVIVYNIEKRFRANRADFLDALNEELDAAERYMKEVKPTVT